MCVFVWQWRVLESNCPVCRVDSLGMKLSSSKHPATILALLTGVQPHPRSFPDFISQPWEKIGRRPGIITTSRTGGGGHG